MWTSMLPSTWMAHLPFLVAWMAVDAPNPAPVAPPGLDTTVNTILSWMKWTGGAGGVAGMFICAGMIIFGRRNRNAMATDGLVGAAWVVGGLSLAAATPALVSVFL